MRPAGEVVRATGGLAVLQAAADLDPDSVVRDDPDPALDGAGVPAAGSEVVDGSLGVVGRVVSVFGPVERPYLAVDADDPAAHIGDRLYVRER